ncbi:MAG: hypothetical protein HY855_09435, partial [Burkholderiales bacterium]|nr:hypothetical protein [Burkholderiales bacterium]
MFHPAAPAPWPPAPPPRTTLTRCVLLALLLHVLLVLWLGNAPGGSAQPGQGVWGRLNVTLRGLRPEPGAGVPARSAAEAGPAGHAREPRFGGAVRSEAAPTTPPDTPGAARLGRFAEQAP